MHPGLFVLLTVFITLNNSGLIQPHPLFHSNKQPTCIWVWYPKFPRYPPRGTINTIAPPTQSTVAESGATASVAVEASVAATEATTAAPTASEAEDLDS